MSLAISCLLFGREGVWVVVGVANTTLVSDAVSHPLAAEQPAAEQDATSGGTRRCQVHGRSNEPLSPHVSSRTRPKLTVTG